jgi:hypothetical protein
VNRTYAGALIVWPNFIKHRVKTGNMKLFGFLAGLAVAEKCATMCPMNIDEVCGTDGNTYTNPCLLETAACELRAAKSGINLVKAYDGTCVDYSECQLACPRIFDPVCTNTGDNEMRTFGNFCEFRSEICRNGIKMARVLHAGECNHDSL